MRNIDNVSEIMLIEAFLHFRELAKICNGKPVQLLKQEREIETTSCSSEAGRRDNVDGGNENVGRWEWLSGDEIKRQTGVDLATSWQKARLEGMTSA